MIRCIKDWLYYLFVQQNPQIQHDYAAYKEVFPEVFISSPFRRWKLIISLNFHYRIMCGKSHFSDNKDNDNIVQTLTCEKILNTIGKGYDDVYLFKHHIGEIYIYLNLISRFINHNGSSNPILIVNQKRHLPLYEMFPAGIKWAYVPISDIVLDQAFPEEELTFHGQRFFSPIPDRFEQLRNEIAYSDGNAHFYDYLLRSFKLDFLSDIHFIKPHISVETRDRTILKAELAHLNLNRFVVLFPEATTASALSPAFWECLCREFHLLGYDVLLNSASENWYSLHAVSFPLALDEVYCLSELSKGVIALVNGLAVTFSQMNVPRFIIYTDQNATTGKPMTSSLMKKSYSMAKLPDCQIKELYELDHAFLTESELSDLILSYYSSGRKKLEGVL